MAPETRHRRDAIKAACEECRLKKTKCDGHRPVCTRCRKRGEGCVYRTEPDESRMEAVRRRLRIMEEQASSCEAVLRVLMQCSDEQAVDVLMRLRSNEPVSSILLSVNQMKAQAASRSQGLPSYIRNSGHAHSTRDIDRRMSASPVGSGGSAASAHSGASSACAITPSNIQTSLPTLVKAVDRQSIGFIISENREQSSKSGNTAHNLDFAMYHSNSVPRASSYPPLDSEMRDSSIEAERRLSEPGPNAASIGEAADGGLELSSADQTPRANADTESADWDAYYTDVSSLLQWLKSTAPKKEHR